MNRTYSHAAVQAKCLLKPRTLLMNNGLYPSVTVDGQSFPWATSIRSFTSTQPVSIVKRKFRLRDDTRYYKGREEKMGLREKEQRRARDRENNRGRSWSIESDRSEDSSTGKSRKDRHPPSETLPWTPKERVYSDDKPARGPPKFSKPTPLGKPWLDFVPPKQGVSYLTAEAILKNYSPDMSMEWPEGIPIPEPLDEVKREKVKYRYYIGRTPFGGLPVYFSTKRGGNLLENRIQHVEGDPRDLMLLLTERLDVPRANLKFHPSTKRIVVKGGYYTEQIKEILEELGF